jgi:hypothetical protein
MKVSVFRELMREQANAAVRISGAHHSSWNGRYGAPIAASSETGGTANWNNTISYNPRHVDEPLQDMFRNNRVHNQDRADLVRYRDALRVVLHENAHLLSSEGREHSQAQAAFGRDPGVRPLEEGVTELYAHQALNDYIDELGVDQVAPGIKDVKSPMVYSEFTPAVQGFAGAIERQSGVQSAELIGRLAVVPADQKFRVAAETMYDNSRLPGLVPEDQRAHAVGQIANAMKSEFGRVARLPENASAQERAQVGKETAAEGYKAVSRLRKQWQMPAAGQQVRRGVGAEQQQTAQSGQGQGRESGQGRQPQQGQGAQSEQGQAAQSARGQGVQEPGSPTGLPLDIAAAARAGLSGPPLTSAGRLSADRQGARGSGTTTPTVQRQGPETHR